MTFTNFNTLNVLSSKATKRHLRMPLDTGGLGNCQTYPNKIHSMYLFGTYLSTNNKKKEKYRNI
jgi:hypothetical protein